MIFRELRFRDFLVFSGEQTLDLRSDRDNSVVVILAPNNTGKTSVIRALKFLFYGDLPDCNEETAYRLLNDRTRALAPAGSEVVGWVEATIELDGDAFVVQRSIRARKSGKEQWMNPTMELAEIRRGKEDVRIPDKQGILQGRLKTMVPTTLFDAFYFKGEPLDGRLLGGVSGIRKSLEGFLHEDAWEEAGKGAESIREQLTREIAKLTENHSEYSKLLSTEELFQGHLRKQTDTLASIREKLDLAVAEWEEISEQLRQVGSATEAERQVTQLKQFTAQRDQAKAARDRADADVSRAVGASRGIPFLLGALPNARRILANLREENILPADITAPFVDRVLAAPKCVCGHVHTPQTREAWTRYKQKTLTHDLSRGLSDLVRAIDEEGTQSYLQHAKNTAQRIENAFAQRRAAVVDLERLEGLIRQLQQQLANSPIEAIRSLSKRLDEMASRRQRLQSELTRVETEMELGRKNLDRVRAEKEKKKPSGAIAQKERQLQRCRERAEKLRLLIHTSLEVLRRSFHRILQESVAQYYDASATDGSKARINRSSLLPVIESNGQVHGNLGGGQSQLLALAYIVSLARLRKTLHEQMLAIGIGLGKIDDQSFFLDSPFNHMTEHYAQAIAHFLKGNARQVVLLLARQQWNLVKAVVEPEVDRFFGFSFKTLPTIHAELKQKDPTLEDFTYTIRGKRLNLVAALPATESHPTTTIIPIP